MIMNGKIYTIIPHFQTYVWYLVISLQLCYVIFSDTVQISVCSYKIHSES